MEENKWTRTARQLARILNEYASMPDERASKVDVGHALTAFYMKFWEMTPGPPLQSRRLFINWNYYFLLGLDDFIENLPTTTADLEQAVAALLRGRRKPSNTLTFETQGTVKVTVSDDVKTWTSDSPGPGSAIVTVKIQKKGDVIAVEDPQFE